MHAIDSPCTKTCDLDPIVGLCHGCGRTLAEIAQWAQLLPAERSTIMAQLPDRLGELREHAGSAVRLP